MRNLKKNEGITLIALIVTIIVLIILAVVSINAIFGEDGIIARAEMAKEQTEMAQIKEEAELVKASLQMDVYEGKIEELNKINLVAGLKDYFEGSTLEGENVVVSNGKYAIVIGDDLSIEVIKNEESSGENTGSGDDSGSGDSGSGEGTEEQGGTIEIAYEIEDVDENTKVINLTYSGEIRKWSEIEEEEIDNFLNRMYSQSGTNYEEEIKEQIKAAADAEGMTYKAFVVSMLEESGEIYRTKEEASIGETKVEIQNLQVIAKRSGTYKISVTDGVNSGEAEVEVTGIIDEKFSEIYTASADYTDSLGNKAKIPKGFAVGTSENINSIDKGLVITDSVDSEGYSNGNEYVWIPVSNINGNGSNKIKVRNEDGTTKEVEITLGRYTFDKTDGTPTKVQYGSEFASETKIEDGNGYTLTWYDKELKDFREAVDGYGIDAKNETAKDLEGFITSVETNGGYFIARYEASYESGDSVENYKLASKVSTIATTSENATLTKGKLWNYITQGDMAKVCKNMYTEAKYEYVEADLINSYAWDTAIVFIQKCSNNSNYANASCETNGNTGTLKNTGLTGDVECNVYDMAGNLLEWSTEYCDNRTTSGGATVAAYPCILRGGHFFFTAYCTSKRGNYDSNIDGYNISGRALLYNSNPGT